MPTKKSIEPKITRRSIEDYIEDNSNANKGSERGLGMVEESLSQDGAGRSIVVDADGRIVAGNKTWEAAALAGIEDVIEVETDGHALIVHRRRDWDLTDVEGSARRYAYRDNRASQVSLSWDAEQLLADVNAGFDFTHLFSETELNILLASQPSDGEWGDAFGNLATGDKAPFQQMTFTLHDTQAQQVQAAVDLAKSRGKFEGSPNENSNGNALARICETYLRLVAEDG